MKWTREQYIDFMTYKRNDRQMLVELFGPLIGLEKEWKEQGATEEELSLDAFGFDCVDKIDVGIYYDVLGGLEPKVIEDSEEYKIERDNLGRTTKLCKGVATIALPLDYPVKTMEDWLGIKQFYTYDEKRINWQQVEEAKVAQKEGALVCTSVLGAFDTVRQLMGEEEGCVAYYTQPELILDIINTITDTAYRLLQEVTQYITIDHLGIHEDMAGKSGPLVGPNIIKEFYKPYYRKIWDLVSSKGAQLFCQDSDGYMDPVIDAFIECGVNIFYPCEPSAGMDIVKLREKYGRKIAFKGGIDKHALRKTKEDIKKELEYKMQPVMKQGGVVYGLDHRIPNGVPIENYRYYIREAKKLLGIKEDEINKSAWERMAF